MKETRLVTRDIDDGLDRDTMLTDGWSEAEMIMMVGMTAILETTTTMATLMVGTRVMQVAVTMTTLAMTEKAPSTGTHCQGKRVEIRDDRPQFDQPLDCSSSTLTLSSSSTSTSSRSSMSSSSSSASTSTSSRSSTSSSPPTLTSSPLTWTTLLPPLQVSEVSE